MMNIQQLNDIIAPSVSSLGYTYVGCEYMPQGPKTLLRIYIDKPKGVNIDDCAIVSRQLSAVFDVEDPIAGRYILEVSSPGRKRRLFTPTQYEQFVGSIIKVKLKFAKNERKNFVGELLQVMEEGILLQVDDTEMTFAFMDIDKANLEPRDD